MISEKSPYWLRAAEVVFGLVAIGLGILVIAVPGIAVATLILLLAIGLVFLGSREIAFGVAGSFLAKWLRAVSIIVGVATLIFSFYVIVFPGLARLTLVLLLYFGLFIRGLGMIALGTAGAAMSTGIRGAAIAVGLLSIILAIVFLALPALAIETLILLLSIGIVLTGIEVIAAGVTGRKITPLVTSPSSLVKP